MGAVAPRDQPVFPVWTDHWGQGSITEKNVEKKNTEGPKNTSDHIV